jgi:hypothetical protein
MLLNWHDMLFATNHHNDYDDIYSLLWKNSIKTGSGLGGGGVLPWENP